MIKKCKINEIAEYSLFESDNGLSELHIIIKPDNKDINISLEEANRNYEEILKKLNINNESLIFGRFFCKDRPIQMESIYNSNIYKAVSKKSHSIIEQQPLNGNDIILYLYQIYNKNGDSPGEMKHLFSDEYGNGTLINIDNYDLLFLGDLQGIGKDAFQQTSNLFNRYNDILKEYGQELNKNFIRSWIYVKDIDDNYEHMVEARKKIFFDNGITKDSIFPASTGIGFNSSNGRKVTADLLSLNKIKPEQIVRMEDSKNMPSPYTYGVTFERGLKIIFGDRAHIHISGTASIDENGEIMHKDDIKKQTERTINNIKSLLNNNGAAPEDIAYLNVYLRDSGMAEDVKKVLDKELQNNIPYIMVKGPVCRPGWLIEIDGMSVKQISSSYPPFQ